jgi:thiol:disulfide interchange protein
MKKVVSACLCVLFSLPLFSQSERDSSNHEGPVGMTVDQFNARTNNKHKLVLVNFKADWCIVCKRMKPALDQIKAENKK